MQFTTDEIIRMERCHVKAWPAFETRDVEGWHWRYSGGASQRANSVSTIAFTGQNPHAALDIVEALYRAKRVPARFHTFGAGAPAGLPGLLRARGYESGETTLTMFKRVQPSTPPVDIEQPADVERYDHATREWREVYLGAITASRRATNARILDAIPEPRAFFACRRDGRVVSTALSVAGYGSAVIECVATRQEVRRQRGAEAVLRALEAWVATQDADLLGLQVVAANAGAIALYERLGFIAGATNQFWTRAP